MRFGGVDAILCMSQMYHSPNKICIVGPYMIVCLYGGLRRRLQSRIGAGDSGASSFAITRFAIVVDGDALFPYI